jgi:hypothetical protein
MVNRNAKVARVAGRQRGLVTWAQLAQLGFDRKTVSDRVRGGYLHPVLPRVYAVGHRAASVEADLWLGTLDFSLEIGPQPGPARASPSFPRLVGKSAS